ncbi:MAG: hypothetical protein L3J88_07465 [Gammaproteobacteria bacterium]|nr:hypothetical protein [Gammaproteobacteria bacterium]
MLDPLGWQQYGAFIYPLIAAMGIGLSVAGFMLSPQELTLQLVDFHPLVARGKIHCSRVVQQLLARYYSWHNIWFKEGKADTVFF